jgi:hypothetical protein
MLQGKESEALNKIKGVALNPTDSSSAIVPQAAKAYIDNYSNKEDIYRACQASLNVMGAAAGIHLYGWDSVDFDFIKQNWGYYVDAYWGHGTICNLRGSFYRLISHLDKTQFSETPEILKNDGVLIRSANQIDVNGDGDLEWILLVDTPGDDSPIDIWILVNRPKKILAIPIVTWERRHYDLPTENVEALNWEVRTINSPNGETIPIVKLGEYLYFFQINAEEDALEWLIDVNDIKSYTIRQSDRKNLNSFMIFRRRIDPHMLMLKKRY